jgi:hypothetical protein
MCVEIGVGEVGACCWRTCLLADCAYVREVCRGLLEVEEIQQQR